MSWRARVQSEQGFSLVELLVVIAIGSVVAAITTGAIITGLHQQRELSARTHTLNEVKMSLERMTREIRAADPVVSAEPDELRVEVKRRGATISFRYRVEQYAAEGNSRHRVVVEEEATDDDTGITTSRSYTLLENLVDGEVFTFTDGHGNEVTVAGDVRTVVLSLRAETGLRGSEVTLRDEITVRNAREHGG